MLIEMNTHFNGILLPRNEATLNTWAHLIRVGLEVAKIYLQSTWGNQIDERDDRVTYALTICVSSERQEKAISKLLSLSYITIKRLFD